MGAAIATAGTGVIITKGVINILLGLFLSPVVGLLLGFLLMHLLIRIFRHFSPALGSKIFNRSPVVSAAYMAFSHGNNDAQKTLGIITMALVSYYQLPDFHVPFWVIFLCASAMGLGTAIISSTIMGVGASKQLSAVRWGVGGNIVLAWVITLPACAILAWVVCKAIHVLL